LSHKRTTGREGVALNVVPFVEGSDAAGGGGGGVLGGIWPPESLPDRRCFSTACARCIGPI
jgi:hypothetical protein